MAWLRLYDDLLDSHKIQTLSDRAFRGLINVWCVAKRHHGIIPEDIGVLTFALRLNERRVRDLLQCLLSAGLIERVTGGYVPHQWDEHQYSGDVTAAERMKRYRKRNGDHNMDRNVTRNALRNLSRNSDVLEQSTETETETETKEKNPKKESSPARQGSLLNGSEAFFLRFYKVFPLHKSRRAAEKAFVSALKRASAEQIIQGAERYRDDPARKLEFTQRPATWLNADGWLDEAQVIAPPAPEDTLDRMLREAKALEAQAKNG